MAKKAPGPVTRLPPKQSSKQPSKAPPPSHGASAATAAKADEDGTAISSLDAKLAPAAPTPAPNSTTQKTDEALDAAAPVQKVDEVPDVWDEGDEEIPSVQTNVEKQAPSKEAPKGATTGAKLSYADMARM